MKLSKFSQDKFNKIFEVGDIQNIFDSIVEDVEELDSKKTHNQFKFIKAFVDLITSQSARVESDSESYSQWLLNTNRAEAENHIKKAMKVPSL